MNPAGGLARRAWLFDQVTKNCSNAPLVRLDTGNVADNPNEEGEIRTRALLEAMDTLGYAAVNVAERDLAMGYAEFRRRTDGLSLKFVSANFVRQGTRDPVFAPYTIVDVGRGARAARVAIIGAVRFNPVWQKAGPDGENLAIAPPREMVARYAKEARSKADVVVLLAALSREDAGSIAREVPEIDFVFGAYGGIYSTFEETEGKARVVYVANQGRYIGETRVFLDGGKKIVSSTSYMHNLTARYPEDEGMKRYVEKVNAKIAGLRAAAGASTGAASAPKPR